MSRVKLAIAAVVVVLFAMISTISAKRHHQVTSLISMSIKNVGWASSELELETLKFMQALRRATLNNIDDDELWLRFDILWSRLDVLSFGEESRPFRNQPQARPLLEDMRQYLSHIEPVLAHKSSSDPVVHEMLDDLTQLYRRIQAFNVKSFSGNQGWGSFLRLSQLQYESNFYLMGLLISGSILIFLLFRANATNQKLAQQDSLTGLLNRYAFHQKLNQVTAHARRKNARYAVYMIDLNDFKDVNDRLGHRAGDKLLKDIAGQLRQILPPNTTLARLGGDEFGILQESIQHPQECLNIAKNICNQLSQGITIEGQQLYPSTSTGISLFPDHAQTPEALLIYADTAMYHAKRSHRSCYQLFHPSINDQMKRCRTLTADLRQALTNNQLRLVYQPIIGMGNRRLVQVEALLRWQHKEYGHIPPPELVAIAEQSGLAEELNEWVLRTACRQNMLWRQADLPPIQVSVNISPAMYTRYNLEAMVSHVLAQTGLPASQLILEITEDTTMQAVESSLQTLQNLHALGVELALDDFGTGYSSLSQLTLMPLKKLKIDKVFIQRMAHNHKEMYVLHSILSLAQNLGLQVTAEGIETNEQYQMMRDAGCHYGQGYLFSKPVPESRIRELLSSHEQQLRSISASTG